MTTISSVAVPTRISRTPEPTGSVDKRGEASRLLRYASQSPIPLTGSVAQTVYGAFEIHEAKTHNQKLNAWVDTVGGASSMLNDASSVALMAHMGGLTGIAGPLNGVTTLLCGGLDAGRDIVNGHASHNKGDYAAAAVKIGSSVLSAVGAFTLNMPLFYAGNILYFGAIAGQNWDSVKAAGHYVAHPIEGAEATEHWVKARFEKHEEERHEHLVPPSASPPPTPIGAPVTR